MGKINFNPAQNLGRYSQRGLPKEEHPFFNRKHTGDAKLKMSKNHQDISGEKNPMFGKPRSEEVKRKISEKKIGKKMGEEQLEEMRLRNKGNGNPFYGKKHSEETKRKISLANKNKERSEEQIKRYKEIFRGERNPNWKGGKSFEPYANGWDNKLKETIRFRDKFTCQLCFKEESEKAFDIHHINYIKKDLNINNLITLCMSCHSRTNAHRPFWETYLKNKMEIKNGTQ